MHESERGVESKLVLANRTHEARTENVDPTLIKAIVRARLWFDQIAQGEVQSISQIAKAEGVTDRYVSKVIPLAFLAPDIVSSILSGSQPVELTTEALTKRTSLPSSWETQREMLGVR
ncbi:MAG: hypothetical protein QF637_14255 [Acidimicrobiales bacterium]|nr:hypothetical protein [Acidimicrobiales bacterium]